MLIQHEPPTDWRSFTKRKDNIGLPIMEIRKKFLEEQLLFENYMQQLNTFNTLSSGAAGGPPPKFPTEFLWFPQWDGTGNEPLIQKVFKSPAVYNGKPLHIVEFDFEDSSIGDRAYYFLYWDTEELTGAWNKIIVNSDDGDDLPWRTLTNEELLASLNESLGDFTPIYLTSNNAVTPVNSNSPLGIYDRIPGDGKKDALTLVGISRSQSGAEAVA